ncbi:MAG: Hsp20 family protein, partial [Candidatus Heimdallarchaeota archaeon]
STTELVIKIKAHSGTRTYKKEITLPTSIIPTSTKAKFNNGVLEITFQRVTPEYSNKIDIE